MGTKTRLEDGDGAEKSGRSWSPRQKPSRAVVVVVALTVGLGVGLTRQRGDGGGGDGGIAPNRTSTWTPRVGEPWQIVLKTAVDGDAAAVMPPGVGILDVDALENDAATVAALRAAGVRVVCYFSAGTREDWRDDRDGFDDGDVGKALDGWPGERWVNVSSPGVREVIRRRIRIAADKGCGAIDPDNVDGYMTAADAADFVRFLSRETASYRMSTGLKNAADIVDDVLDAVAFSVNEQCAEADECARFAPFVRAGKPVFHIEYPRDAARPAPALCAPAGADRFSIVLKRTALDGWVEYCDGRRFTSKAGR